MALYSVVHVKAATVLYMGNTRELGASINNEPVNKKEEVLV